GRRVRRGGGARQRRRRLPVQAVLVRGAAGPAPRPGAARRPGAPGGDHRRRPGGGPGRAALPPRRGRDRADAEGVRRAVRARAAGRPGGVQGRAAGGGLGLRLRRRPEHRRGVHQRAAAQDRRTVRPRVPGDRARRGLPAGRAGRPRRRPRAREPAAEADAEEAAVRRLSVRLRATRVATVTVALALGVSAAVLAWTLRSSLEESVGEEAARRLAAATHSIAVATDDGRLTVMHDIGRVPNPDPDVRISPSPDPSWGEGYATATGKVPVGAGTLTVQARASLRPVQDALAALRSLLLVGVPVLLLLVAVLTWTLVGRTLAPVSAIRAKFASITANDLHERVPVPETRDEVAHLARTM